MRDDPISGYDPGLTWKSAGAADFGLLRLNAERIAAFNAPERAQGIAPRRWQA